jgi:hypothetical protein
LPLPPRTFGRRRQGSGPQVGRRRRQNFRGPWPRSCGRQREWDPLVLSSASSHQSIFFASTQASFCQTGRRYCYVRCLCFKFYDQPRRQVTLFGKLNGKPDARLQLRLRRNTQQVWFCHLEEKVGPLDQSLADRVDRWYFTRGVASPSPSVVMIPQGNSPVRPQPISSSSCSQNSEALQKKRLPAPGELGRQQQNSKRAKTVIVLD